MTLQTLPEEALKELLLLTEAKRKLELREKAQENFMSFAHHVYENFIEGRHHRIIAEKLEKVARGELKRLIINMPPRHSKSEFASYLMPAWFLGRNPKLKIIQATHNTELAVRFGRKARDLVADERYTEIFPKVQLKEDSKSAGRWQTSHGGEYFACLTPDTPVDTRFGPCPAGAVSVGDVLRTAAGEVTVQKVYHTQHDATVSFGGIKCSKNHPVWTMNRGWVAAAELSPSDILCVESIYDKLKAPFRRVRHGVMEHPVVQTLVQHALTLSKPAGRALSALRRAGDRCLRAMGSVLSLSGGHGRTAYDGSHAGSNRRERALQSAELPVGHGSPAVEQQAEQRPHPRENLGGYGSGDGNYAGGSQIPDRAGAAGRRRAFYEQKTQGNAWGYSPPEDLGWLRHRTALLLEGRGRRGLPGEPGNRTEKRLARLRGWAQKLSGLLLGVRRVGALTVRHHAPEPFVNYLVDGDNTFFSCGILTHNCGVGAAMTGRGADLLVIDDPHSEQDALSETAFDQAYEWYTSGPRQRLQPGGAIIIVMTRWSKKDLTGRLLAAQAADVFSDKWDVVEFPAILPSGEPLWPEFWKKDELLRLKATLPLQKWLAQWQQQPTTTASAIIKREWWRNWEHEDPPTLSYILQAYDTAFSKKESADYSAITTWGVFKPDPDGPDNIILLDAQRGRWSFPELKEIAFEEQEYWNPDMVIIEAKASGMPLIDELRKRGIPALSFSPGGRGGGRDKVSRMHMVAPLFEAGMVWIPMDKRFADDVVEEVTSFPNGEHDDYCDSLSLGLLRFRQGGFISLAGEDDDKEFKVPRKREYY